MLTDMISQQPLVGERLVTMSTCERICKNQLELLNALESEDRHKHPTKYISTTFWFSLSLDVIEELGIA